MAKYVKFSATVTWFDVKEEPEVKRPLTGLYYEVIYRRGNKDKKIGDGYLNDEGCFTISREETKKLPFDSKTYFETHIYSKTEECDVFWRKRKTGQHTRGEIVFSTQYSGELTRGEFWMNYDAEDNRKRIFIAHLLNQATIFVKNKYGYKPPKVKCVFPYTEEERKVSACSGNLIMLIGDAWGGLLHTLFHEYAHALQHDAWPLSQRKAGMNHDYYMDFTANISKERGLNAVFVEAFADYFANRVYDVIKFKLGNIPFTDSLEEVETTTKERGEGNENSVAAFLYDLTDDTDKEKSYYVRDEKILFQTPLEPMDRIKYSDKKMFNTIKNLKKINLYYLVKKLYSDYPDDVEGIKLLLTMNGISPHNIRTKRIDSKRDIFEIEWEPGGTKTSKWLDDDLKSSETEGPCKTYQDECNVFLSSIKKPEKCIVSSGPLKNKESYCFKYSDVKPLFETGDNAVVIKIQGRCTEKEATEYESCYCLVGFDSFRVDDEFVILPNILLAENGTSIDGVKVSSSSHNVFIDGHFNILMEYGSYFCVFFENYTFNDVQLEFDGDSDGSFLRVTASDQVENSMNKNYVDLVGKTALARISRLMFRNINFDATCLRIDCEGSSEKIKALKRIILSTKPAHQKFSNSPRHVIGENNGGTLFDDETRRKLEKAKTTSVKVPMKPKKK